jgi:hypothetical protein
MWQDEKRGWLWLSLWSSTFALGALCPGDLITTSDLVILVPSVRFELTLDGF